MDDSGKKKMKQGGLRTMPFILGNEICDRFATSGFGANMITYLTKQLHMPLVNASNTLTNFNGTASLTPLLGAWIADSYAGRFWTITIGSLIYQMGMIVLTVSAIVPNLRPRACKPSLEPCPEASMWQISILYISLFLTSLGSGGIRPCVVPFGADQFDMGEATNGRSRWNYFNWFYICMGITNLLSLTTVVYTQDNVGWGWGFGIPTIAMAVSVVAFVIGYPLYRDFKPAGSPMTRIVQVIVAAIKKRNAAKPTDPDLLYQNKVLDASISVSGRLLHTNQLKFFDRAAIVTESDTPGSDPPNLWRLVTVHRVEELKSLIRLLPIWSTGILLVAASSHQGSFSIQQAWTMDRHMSRSFQIPPATMSIFSTLTLIFSIALYDRLFVPIARRFTGNPAGITYLQRMGVGFSIAIFATLAAGFVEIRRKKVAADHGLLDQPHAVIPISVFWLVPQYSIHGLAEAFMVVGHMEFLYDQAPESMRSTASALFWTAISVGSYLSTFLVSLVHKYSGERNWLPNRNLNRGRLECYYWLMTGLQVFNLGYYVLCARLYRYKSLQVLYPSSPKHVDGMGENGHVETVDIATQEVDDVEANATHVALVGDGHVEPVDIATHELDDVEANATSHVGPAGDGHVELVSSGLGVADACHLDLGPSKI